MRIFNRIVMIIGILLLLFVALVLMIRPLEAIDWLRVWLDYFEESIFDANFFYIYLGVLAGLLLILLILLWLEIRRPRRKTVRIKTQGGGTAELGTQSVAQSLEYRIDELAGVRDVKTHIKSRGRDVEVDIDLDTSPSVNIPVLTDQVMDLTHEIVEKQLGVKIHGKVKLRVRHEPYPRGTMPSSGAMGDEAVVPPRRSKPAPAPEPPAEAESKKPEATPAAEREPQPKPSAEPTVVSLEDEGDEDQAEEQESDSQSSTSGW
jgi:hypothetical protein